MHKVILNLYDDPRLSELEEVCEGDYIYATDSEFYLTKGKKYKLLCVNGPTCITVENDVGKEEIYTIEYFSKYEPIQ